jgi:ribosome-binding protein aMBF1 (putative translation factor)
VYIFFFLSICLVKKKQPRKYFKDQNLLNEIGKKIREIRLSRNISQESLANEIEMDYSQINRMELGKVNFSISYLYRISKALDVDPKKLLP